MLHFAPVLLFQAAGRSDPRALPIARSGRLRSLRQRGKLAASSGVTGAPGSLAAMIFPNLTRDQDQPLAGRIRRPSAAVARLANGRAF
jgi:hypothetical protein